MVVSVGKTEKYTTADPKENSQGYSLEQFFSDIYLTDVDLPF